MFGYVSGFRELCNLVNEARGGGRVRLAMRVEEFVRTNFGCGHRDEKSRLCFFVLTIYLSIWRGLLSADRCWCLLANRERTPRQTHHGPRTTPQPILLRKSELRSSERTLDDGVVWHSGKNGVDSKARVSFFFELMSQCSTGAPLYVSSTTFDTESQLGVVRTPKVRAKKGASRRCLIHEWCC